MRRSSGKKIHFDLFAVVLYSIVLLYVLSMIFILGFGLLNSVKYWVDYNTGNIFGLPKQEYGWRFENYVQTFNMFFVQIKPIGQAPRNIYMFEMFFNSLLYSVSTTAFMLITQVSTAYAVAKYNFRFKKLIYAVAIVVMIIPIIGSLASEVQIATFLGLKDSILGVSIMRCKYPGLYFLVFYATFKSLSWSYAESAQLDGASHFQVMIQIMIPLVKSSVFAVFILQFIANWNDYYTPMIFIPNKPTISYGLYEYQSNVDTAMSIPIKLAACVITCLPIILLFVCFQKQIMGNVTMGGIKG